MAGFVPQRHEVDRSGLPTGTRAWRCGHLFLDELDRLADRLDGAHRSGCSANGLPHRDLNYPRGVLAGALLASTRPSSWPERRSRIPSRTRSSRVLRRVPWVNR